MQGFLQADQYIAFILEIQKIVRKWRISIMNIQFSSIVFKEGNTYVAYCPELDVSSCGDTPLEAKNMLKEAIRLFIEETERMGTMQSILEESGFSLDENMVFVPPKIVSTEPPVFHEKNILNY